MFHHYSTELKQRVVEELEAGQLTLCEANQAAFATDILWRTLLPMMAFETSWAELISAAQNMLDELIFNANPIGVSKPHYVNAIRERNAFFPIFATV